MPRIVVVGAGIVGITAAHRLALAGAEVTVADPGLAGRATAAGAGIVSPGSGGGEPPPLLDLIRLGAGFSGQLLEQLAEDGQTDTGHAVCGLLDVATADQAGRLRAALERAERRDAAGFRLIGRPQLLDGAQARELHPALAPGIAAAVHLPGAARIDGRRLRSAIAAACAARGVEFVAGSASLRLTAGRVEAVLDRAPIGADGVILAAGAWSAAIAGGIGLALDVRPQRGQILHLAGPPGCADWPIVTGSGRHYLLSFPGDRVVAGATHEDASGLAAQATASGAAEVLAALEETAPGLARRAILEHRAGLRPVSGDGLPLLGRVPGIENLVVATGNGATGLQLGPVCGAIAADAALGAPASLPLDPFRPDRPAPAARTRA